MLRITMLKLKRTWSLALTLRNRGETKFPGKLHRLTTLRSAQKSTYSNKDNEWKCKQIIDYLFSPLRTHDEIRRIQSIIISDIRRLRKTINKKNKDQPVQGTEVVKSDICPQTHDEKCNKLIAAVFGEKNAVDSRKVSDPTTPKRDLDKVLSTTAKQTEEQLAQKVELIDETPLVEAQKPKIEGFNTPPRVLGQDHSSNIDAEAAFKENVHNKLNSVTKKIEHSEIFSKITPISQGVVNFSSDCSNQGGNSDKTPEGTKQNKNDSITEPKHDSLKNKLRNRVIKDMQQLGVPQGSADNSTIHVDVNTSKKPHKPSTKTEMELEARKYEPDSPTSSDLNQTTDSDKKINVKTLHDNLGLRLREEGIRYSEQRTPSSEPFKKSDAGTNPASGDHQKNSNTSEKKSQEKILASDADTPAYEPFWYYKKLAAKANEKEETANSEETEYEPKITSDGTGLNRNMPYCCSYNLDDASSSLQDNDYFTDLTKCSDQSKSNETSELDKEMYQKMELYRDLPYYYQYFLFGDENAHTIEPVDDEMSIHKTFGILGDENACNIEQRDDEMSTHNTLGIFGDENTRKIEQGDDEMSTHNTLGIFGDENTCNIEQRDYDMSTHNTLGMFGDENARKIEQEDDEMSTHNTLGILGDENARNIEQGDDEMSTHNTLGILGDENTRKIEQEDDEMSTHNILGIFGDENALNNKPGGDEMSTHNTLGIFGDENALTNKPGGDEMSTHNTLGMIGDENERTNEPGDETSIHETLGNYADETTSQSSCLARDMSYYQNEICTTDFMHRDEEKSDDQKKITDILSMCNQEFGSNSDTIHQIINFNRDMPYYYQTCYEMNSVAADLGQSNYDRNFGSNLDTTYQETHLNRDEAYYDKTFMLQDQEKVSVDLPLIDQTLSFSGVKKDRDLPYYSHLNVIDSDPFDEHILASTDSSEPPKAEDTSSKTPKNIYTDTHIPIVSDSDTNPDVECRGLRINAINRDLPYYKSQNLFSDVWQSTDVSPLEQLEDAHLTAVDSTEQSTKHSEIASLIQPNCFPDEKRREFGNFTPDKTPDNIFLEQHTSDPFFNELARDSEFDEGDTDAIFLEQHTADPSYDIEYVRIEQDETALEKMPADQNPDNIDLDQHTDDPSFDQVLQEPTQVSHHWQDQLHRALYTADPNFYVTHDNTTLPADEDPDNIDLDQNTGDPSFDQAPQLHRTLYTADPNANQQKSLDDRYQHFAATPDPTIVPADEDPDNIDLDQNTGDPSFDQAPQLNKTLYTNDPNAYHQKSLQNRYQNFEANTDSSTVPTDENPDNIDLDQHTGDPSFDQAPQEPWVSPYTHPPVATAEQVEQLNAFYANPMNRGLLPPANYHPHFNPWNPYPYYISQQQTGQEEIRQEHDNGPSAIAPNQETTETSNEQYLEAHSIPPVPFYPNLHPFQNPAGIVPQNPYFYPQNHPYFSKFPHHQSYWGNMPTPQGSQKQHYSKNSNCPQVDSIAPNQNTPMTNAAPIARAPMGFPAPPGTAAVFVSMPQVKWKKGTSPKSSRGNHGMDGNGSRSLSETTYSMSKGTNMPLSEMLKKVRRRNRLEFLQGCAETRPVEGKCPHKTPQCPPAPPLCPEPPLPIIPPCQPPPACPRPCNASGPPPKRRPPPPCPPPTPPPFCPPPPCPPPSTPCHPDPCKFEAISLEDLKKTFTIVWDFGSSKLGQERPLCSSQPSRTVIVEDIVTVLQDIGSKILTTYGSNLGKYCSKLENLALARGFEPWVPVPSWPIPSKPETRKPFACPKEGCKQRPPPKYGDSCERPCYPGNPCIGFPNKFRKH